MRRAVCGFAASLLFLGLLLNSPLSAQPSSALSLVLAERLHGEVVRGIARDSEGHIWVVAESGDGQLPTTADALSRTKRARDIYLQRLAPDGSLEYATYVGGSADDYPTGLAVDNAGNIYVTGLTGSVDFPTTPGAFDRLCGSDGTCKRQPSDMAGTWDAFVIKLTPGGRSLTYSTFLGGRDSDQPTAIAIDGLERAVVTGYTFSTDFPTTAGAFQTGNAGGYDAFVSRLSTDGSRLESSTYFGGADSDIAYGIAADSTGDVFFGGWTMSGNFPVRNAMRPAIVGDPAEGFLARMDAAGAVVFSTYIGGSMWDQVSAVAVSANAVYLAGSTCSRDFPGAPRPGEPFGCDGAGFASRVRLDGSALDRTELFDGSYADDAATSIAVDAHDVVYVTGYLMSPDVAMSADAEQIATGGWYDAFFAAIPMAGPAASPAPYRTYHGGTGADRGWAVAVDGTGGAWIGGATGSADYPEKHPKVSTPGPAFVAHYTPTDVPVPESDDIVLYARDATSISGNWQLVDDPSAAGGRRIWNPDAGAPKIGTASAAPESFFELTFQAEAGVPYHLWLRMKADNDHWANDSVYVQFSDSVNGGGGPVWRTGTTGATTVSLEDCTGCGEHGWGWNDNGYDTPGIHVEFAQGGSHTIRIQQREDGVSVDQVVLSSRTYINSAPGGPKDDGTILPVADDPPPPPPTDPKEIVLYAASDRGTGGQNWMMVADTTAAGGSRLLNPDSGQPKSSSPAASGSDYFEVAFTAEAGVPYHLWVRSQATDDYYGNDSVMVQFSDSVDVNGASVWRIGTNSSSNVIGEDCSGCGLQGWGWTDNAYGGFGTPVYFATSGPQTIRVLRREDGISIDQIVLSAGRYLNTSPGQAKNDTTIVPK
jgi:hypothetical protein